MEADFFAILRLRPGLYGSTAIDQQYRSVRQEILLSGGPARQRRLDDLLIAQSVLRSPRRQAALVRRYHNSLAHRPTRKPARRPMAVLPAQVDRPNCPTQRARRDVGADADVYARFARLVGDHVESGLLRFSVRQQLMQTAKAWGVGQFKANLVIAEVLHDIRAGRPDPGREVTGPTLSPETRTPRTRYGLRIGLAIAAALVADAALLLGWLWL